MIDAELFRDEGVLTVFPVGELSARDFAQLAALVDPYVETDGRLNGLMVIAEHFPGWADFAALAAHIRFVRDHHREIRRVAVVTDSTVLELLPALARHFVQAEIRQFPFDQRDAAFAWLKRTA
jgi:hypothetical protein